jgi:hypothetical protein
MHSHNLTVGLAQLVNDAIAQRMAEYIGQHVSHLNLVTQRQPRASRLPKQLYIR